MNPEPEDILLDPEFDEGPNLTDAELEERIAGGTADDLELLGLLKRIRENNTRSK